MSELNKKEIETVFNNIYDESYLSVLGFVSSRCRHTEDVQDIMQDIYLELLKTLKHKKRGYIENPGAFVMSLAKRKLYKHYTLSERIRMLVPIYKDESIEPIDEIGGFEFEDELIDEIMLTQVWRIILSTDDITRKIFDMRYNRSLSLDKISKELDLPLHSVRNQLYRTLDMIKKRFEKGETK
jgi:RNA polymerase sigma-70 factor (ECF subfamily)